MAGGGNTGGGQSAQGGFGQIPSYNMGNQAQAGGMPTQSPMQSNAMNSQLGFMSGMTNQMPNQSMQQGSLGGFGQQQFQQQPQFGGYGQSPFGLQQQSPFGLQQQSPFGLQQQSPFMGGYGQRMGGFNPYQQQFQQPQFGGQMGGQMGGFNPYQQQFQQPQFGGFGQQPQFQQSPFGFGRQQMGGFGQPIGGFGGQQMRQIGGFGGQMGNNMQPNQNPTAQTTSAPLSFEEWKSAGLMGSVNQQARSPEEIAELEQSRYQSYLNPQPEQSTTQRQQQMAGFGQQQLPAYAQSAFSAMQGAFSAMQGDAQKQASMTGGYGNISGGGIGSLLGMFGGFR